MKARIAAAVAGLMLMLGAPIASATDTRYTSSASQTRLADMRTADFRVVVSATKSGSGRAPTAKAAVATFHRSDGRWLRTGRHVLRGSYFWHTLSGPNAICRLDLQTAAARANERPHVTVQLLMTPSLGCARAYDFVLAAR